MVFKKQTCITHTGKSTLTSVPSSSATRQVMMDFASPAAGMWVAALWASLSRSFSACLRIDRRPRVRRKKLSIFAMKSKTEEEHVNVSFSQKQEK